MKRILKNCLSLILVLTILTGSGYAGLNEVDFSGIFAVKASAASESDLTFTLNDNGKSYSVTACNKSAKGELAIPSTYKGLPVTSIADSAFKHCKSLTSVAIPDSVTNIGNSAFYFCSKLTSITIPDSVTSIGSSAFKYCDSLTSVTIPDSVTSIGNYAFQYCGRLTSVTISDSVTSIEDYAFHNCENLSAINVDENNKNYSSVSGVLFNKDKTKLIQYPQGKTNTEYTIPNSVTIIGDDAFAYCKKLTAVKIPSSVTSICAYAFYNCTSLTSVIVPNSVTSMGECAFGRCEALKSVTIGKKIKTISNWTFIYCVNLTEITIPESVTKIGESAFNGCDNLKKIYYGGSTDSFRKVVVESGNDSIFGAVVYCLKPSTPKLSKIGNTTNGVKITWGKTAGAESYNVYRKTYSNGKWSSWSVIKTGATGTSYTDTTAKSGASYRYTVRAKNEAGLSGYNSTGLRIQFLSTPKLSSISNGSGKVTVKWGKVTGASGYTVYRKTYSNGKWSGWSKIGTTKNTYYNDTKVSSGKYYKYTVRATNGDYTSYYDKNGLQIKYLAVAPLKSATSQKAGVKVTWGAVTGAKGYAVYRRTYSNGKWSDWTKIKTVSSGTTVSCTDKSAKKGVTYKYTVRAISDSNRGYYNTSGLQVKDMY